MSRLQDKRFLNEMRDLSTNRMAGILGISAALRISSTLGISGVLLISLLTRCADARDQPSPEFTSSEEVTTDSLTGPDSHTGAQWWSLQPLEINRPPSLPNIPTDWQANPIDRFIYKSLSDKGLQPSPPASSRVLIRRATYDLIGLPPTPREVTAFQQACQQETGFSDQVGSQAYQQLIERLLDSPHYGEHWGRHWLDVVRFGESRGFERNEIINNAWPFRDYIIRSLNEDKPFNQLVLEHLAGDVIDPGNPQVEAGAMFLVSGPYDDVGNQDPQQAAIIRANTVDEIIRTSGEAFLGLTFGCARCHDHKFDPISQQDYYRLSATFAGVHHGSRVVATEQQQTQLQKQQQPLQAAQQEFSKRVVERRNSIFERAEKKAHAYDHRWTRPPANRLRTEETFPPVLAKYVRLIGEATDTNVQSATHYKLDEFEVWTAAPSSRNVALAEAGGQANGKSSMPKDFAAAYSPQLTIDGQFAARWLALSADLTITLPQTETVTRVVFSSDRPGAAGKHPVAAFVCDYRIEVSLDGRQWTEVANSHDRQPVSQGHRRHRMIELEMTSQERQQIAQWTTDRQKVEQQLAAMPKLASWWIGNSRQPGGPQHVLLGGNPQRPGETVFPASPQVLHAIGNNYQLEADAPEGQRRLAFARWLVAADNPLTKRVLANRIWQYHFGTGIVATPNDFGSMGGKPSHPELLDWLAQQIQDQGWQIKPLHRQLMLSQTYRQAGTYRMKAARVDSQARSLWRFPPHRLTSHQLRDSMLQVAGKLDTKMKGPGFRLYQYLQDNVATYVPLDHFGPETYRRSIYHQNARASLIDLLTEFDSPDCAFSVPRRTTTTTPLQALTLLNHSFTSDMSDALTARIEHEASGQDRAAQIQRAFWLIFSRPAEPPEVTAAQPLIEQFGLTAFCRGLFNTNEFIYID
ncbi:MAG: DUF1553 domain-containing protein [Pirellulales bacterium]